MIEVSFIHQAFIEPLLNIDCSEAANIKISPPEVLIFKDCSREEVGHIKQ